ncbi:MULTISPECIES: PH domain-containing protein [unclassified Staphylococcus]|uniref:PH domain-containing protein n=1 Tax=unclassified Staphylococcus TaxID=91994 RepID=UPI0021CEB26B|nr:MULTISPECIES: PH domain-containing protein [unclassified Staphylococcus]UXR69310.1 PH domain-containing protein [Staphylococcus sp. IVB6246]UXR75956.1 PH domain-containing protein [Staphylococcus sp. IVB6233]UXR80153.1 PH domain-containing protein [Staphylococcus sp. IVB6218]
MILDRVNPEDLFPTEKTGPSVLGKIEYTVNGQREFEGAYIATNERLIMNVDMNGQFYYRNIPYNEISSISFEDDTLWMGFEVGKVAMRHIQNEQIDDFINYVQQQINKYAGA